jgi:hypothetical protein
VNTEKGQASRARYEFSPKAHETRARYEASLPGISARDKARRNALGAQIVQRAAALGFTGGDLHAWLDREVKEAVAAYKQAADEQR